MFHSLARLRPCFGKAVRSLAKSGSWALVVVRFANWRLLAGELERATDAMAKPTYRASYHSRLMLCHFDYAPFGFAGSMAGTDFIWQS